MTFEKAVRRREDMVRLRFEFHNLVLDNIDPRFPRLVRQGHGAAFVVVHFPPQALVERAGADGATAPPAGSLDARLSGETRLAFTLPDDLESIPYTTVGLLAWTGLTPRLAPLARVSRPGVPPPPKPSQPLGTETAVEVPWWLIVSPGPQQTWVNAVEPVDHGGRVEVWHTRLARRGGPEGPAAIETEGSYVRALWGGDADFQAYLDGTRAPASHQETHQSDYPFDMPMCPRDRVDIVRRCSDWSIAGYVPRPVEVHHLALSSLGAWLDCTGDWGRPVTGVSLMDWRHRATQGRDHYVRIIRAGWMFPFGHPSVEITITERRFVVATNGVVGAYSQQRTFLVVRRPVQRYPGFADAWDGRKFPFRSVRCATLVTPNILKEKLPDLDLVPKGLAYLVNVGTAPLQWQMVGTDWDGNEIPFTTPMVFVDHAVGFKPDRMNAVREAWNTYEGREISLRGQRVAFAGSLVRGDTTTEVASIAVTADAPANAPVSGNADASAFVKQDQPLFHPSVETASIRLGPVEQATGTSDGVAADANVTTYTLAYDDTYLAGAFGPTNHGGVWATFAGGGVPLHFSADRGGGVITPNFDAGGMSRVLGPVGGDLGLLKGGGSVPGTFSPASVFGGVESAKLLGGIPLGDLLLPATLAGGDSPAPPDALRLAYATSPTAIETRIDWRPKLHQVGIFYPGAPTMSLRGRVRTDLADPARSESWIEGELSAFSLRLLEGAPLLRIDFHRLRFLARSGQKPTIDVDIAETTFDGFLGFVHAIEPYISFAGGTGPYVELKGTNIESGVAIPLPSLTLLVFALTDIKFGAVLTIPLLGDPVRIRFYFSTKEDPFHLTVFCLGGGGWVELEFGPEGIERLSVGLEAGAELSQDFGVASGSVSVMVGISLSVAFEDGAESCSLTAYFRFRGEIDVMGLIDFSLQLYLALEYVAKDQAEDVFTGQAILTIEIDVLCFSGSVELEVERSIGGDPADPTFADQLNQDDWDRYCDAFAALAG